MIITVLKDKYRCGSNRGIFALDEKNVLTQLNAIIDLDLSKFPYKPKEKEEDPDIEDREFLGKEPELKPGNMFLIGSGQLIAVDNKDRLILILSESGPLALRRIYDENIKLEFDLKFNYPDTTVNFEKSDLSYIPENYKEFTVPYTIMMAFKNNFLVGRDYPSSGLCIKATMDSENYVIPVTLFIKDWTVAYNPLELPEEQLPDASKELISWFYNNFKPEIKEIKEENLGD